MLSKKRYNYYLTYFLVAILCTASVIGVYSNKLLYMAPLLVSFGLFFTVFILAYSRYIPYILLALSYFGYFLFPNMPMIGLTLTDAFFYAMVFMFLFNKGNWILKGITTDRLFLAIVFFLIVILVSYSINIGFNTLNQSIISATYLIKALELPIVFWIFYIAIKSGYSPNSFGIVTIFMALTQIPVVIYQFFTSSNPENIVRAGIHGTISPHHAATGTFLLIPFAYSVYKSINTRNSRRKVIYVAVSFTIFFLLVMSGSRSALVGLLSGSTLFALSRFKLKIEYFFYAMVAVFIAIVLYFVTPLHSIVEETINSNDTSTLDVSSLSRLFIWQGAIINFKHFNIVQKLFGIGIGNYHSMEYPFLLMTGGKYASGAHDNTLHVLIETGLLGLISFMSMFFVILKELYRKSKYNINSFANIFFFLTVGMLLSGLTQETFWFQKTYTNIWMLYIIFLVIAVSENDNRKEIDENQ